MLPYLGRVMGDAKKSYEGFREICVNIRQAPLTVLPGFASTSFQTECITEKSQERREELSGAEQSRAEQSRAEQSRAEQSGAEQSRAEQSRAEQNRAEQSRAEQRRAERVDECGISAGSLSG